MAHSTITIPIDRVKTLRKWKPVIESVFEGGLEYLLPYIEEEIACQLEEKSYFEQSPYSLNTIPGAYIPPVAYPPPYVPANQDFSKLPQFARNIRIYLEKTIPNFYMDNIQVGLNPLSGEMVFKYNGELLDVKGVQKARIEEYLEDIDFYNVVGKLYDTDPKVLLRKKKLENLK